MKLSKKKLEQLKNKSIIQEIVKAFSFDEGAGAKYEDFDFTPEVADTIGVNDKMFVRCPTQILPHFIESMMEENSYIVPSKQTIKEGIIPDNVSVIVKSDTKKFAVREVVGSQILNWFKVNTCYNCAVKTTFGHDMISVDMIGENEKFFAFYELKNINAWGTCEDQLKVVREMLSDKNLIRHKIVLTSQQKDKIIEDYVYSHLVRRVLLSDDDFGTRNCGILYNKKTGQARLANFDFEYVADPKGANRSNIMEDLKFISSNYPALYHKFLQKVEQICLAKKELYNSLDVYAVNHGDNTRAAIQDILDKMFDNIGKMHSFERSKRNIFKKLLNFFAKERDGNTR